MQSHQKFHMRHVDSVINIYDKEREAQLTLQPNARLGGMPLLPLYLPAPPACSGPVAHELR
jgi:hypothetical protein